MFILDLLFPPNCLSCSSFGSYICLDCQKKLKPAPLICLYCGKMSLYGLTHPGCRRELGVDAINCVYVYDPAMKKIIKNIKYRLVKKAFPELLNLVPGQTIKLLKNSFGKNRFVVQPLPLHPQRLKERGFNQAESIGRFLAKKLSLSSIDVLTRAKPTQSQAKIGQSQKRYQNVRGVFETKQKTHPNILLVDDVVTTGSTVKEATRVLKKSGVEKVFVFALARG
jgi:competence protein ComFC